MALEIIWFFLWGLLWAIYFITDGFDLGVGSMIPFLAKNDSEKRIMYNSLGPLWDGNEVWLITAGGVTFAAFPLVYSVMFSTLYTPLMLILFALILRGVSFEFRHQINNPSWQLLWDCLMCAGSFIPAFLFGVAFANIFQGIPFDENGVFYGNICSLLNPYGILGGMTFALLFLFHGCIWLAIKTENDLKDRAIYLSQVLWFMLLVVCVVFIAASKYATNLFDNFYHNPILYLIVIITVISLISARIFISNLEYWKAWFASALTIAGCVFFGIIGLFPNLFPSSINSAFNLTAYNSSSSPLTLKIMLIVVLLFLPIVLAYQIWSYILFKDKVEVEELIY